MAEADAETEALALASSASFFDKSLCAAESWPSSSFTRALSFDTLASNCDDFALHCDSLASSCWVAPALAVTVALVEASSFDTRPLHSSNCASSCAFDFSTCASWAFSCFICPSSSALAVACALTDACWLLTAFIWSFSAAMSDSSFVILALSCAFFVFSS